MDIETVAIYSEADKESLHVQIADEAYCVGPTISKESYLNLTNIISVAKLTGRCYSSGIRIFSRECRFRRVMP